MTDATKSLETLAAEIASLGDNIKSLKESGADGATIKAQVDLLLSAKRQYADQNNGIGVDGQPFVEKMTKAQKKAAAKGEGGGPAKPVSHVLTLYNATTSFGVIQKSTFWRPPMLTCVLLLPSPLHSYPHRWPTPIPRVP